jgi:hypothetical protein
MSLSQREEQPMKVTGRCHCGSVRYQAEIDPTKVSMCHCSDCQMLTGSAFRANVPAPKETFRLEGGPLKIYVKTADSGARRAHAFCPECGTPVYATAVTDPGTYSLRIGCLDQRHALRPSRQIWCKSALPWSSNLEGIERLDRQ